MKLLSALPLLVLALAACDHTPGRVEPGTLPDGGRASVPESATSPVPQIPDGGRQQNAPVTRSADADAGPADAGPARADAGADGGVR